MAKNKISEWSSTAANNTDIGGIDIAEGCAPSGINNAIREIMAQVKDQQTGTDADNFTVGGNLTVTGTTTLSTVLPVVSGGTGASTASAARTSLGLGTIATQASSSVSITGGSITGITDLLPADGGTGRSTLTAKSVLVGNGTDPVNFVAPSTSGNVLTSNGTDWTSATPAGTIGNSQTWESVTRVINTSYTNNTGKPIQVNASIVVGGNGSSILKVDNIDVDTIKNQFGDRNLTSTMSAIVPNGSTYIVTAGTINFWAELR